MELTRLLQNASDLENTKTVFFSSLPLLPAFTVTALSQPLAQKRQEANCAHCHSWLLRLWRSASIRKKIEHILIDLTQRLM
jgi:hypothetical protein